MERRGFIFEFDGISKMIAEKRRHAHASDILFLPRAGVSRSFAVVCKNMHEARNILSSLRMARFTPTKAIHLYIFNLEILYQANS